MGALGEDIEDELRSVHDLAAEQVFEVSLLGRAEFAIEHDQVGLEVFNGGGDGFDLSPAYECGTVRDGSVLHDRFDNVPAGRTGEFPQFVERFLRLPWMFIGDSDTYEDSFFLGICFVCHAESNSLLVRSLK
ncbi:MAG: hypothetical protein Kow0099_29990 [Candidatus Abyssubacteria bacterium]